MLLLYTLSVRLYFLLAKVIAPFNRKAYLFTTGRKDLLARITNSIKEKDKQIAWFHCSSLGEFEQARPVIEKFKTEFPTYKIFLTFFSPSGYEIRKNYSGADYVFYLPMDSRKNAVRLLNIIKPRIAFFTKYEFWFYFLDELQKRKIPSICFSAKFRESQVFFKSYGKFYQAFLKKFTHIFVQDVRSIDLLKKINIQTASLGGDTRFDRVLKISKTVKKIDTIEDFLNNKPAFIIGSSWPRDMEILTPFINGHSDQKFIIAPHEIHEEEIGNLVKNLDGSVIRFSKLNMESITDSKVLIIDTIGLLSQIYQYGSYAYIGGGFGKGIHNILEAAAFGMPIIFGPNYQKFQEAKDLIKIGGAFSINSHLELEQAFIAFNDTKRLEAGQKALKYVQGNTGATLKTINYTKNILPSS